MTMEAMPLCYFCKYKIKGVRKCKIFPEGIPDEAYDNDHVLPVKGDDGVVFEPAEEYADDEYLRDRVEDFRGEFTAKKLKEEEDLEKSLYPDNLQKSAQPLEEWADELLPKEFVKADLSNRPFIFGHDFQHDLINTFTLLFRKLREDPVFGVDQGGNDV